MVGVGCLYYLGGGLDGRTSNTMICTYDIVTEG